MTEDKSGPLEGIRVIDLSRVLGGPYCTQVLADYGADVVKVEPPQGDETRGWGPPFNDGLSAYFSGANRNKRSIVIDAGRPEGREIILRLLDDADVLVHNFKPGALEKWGLGFEAVLRERFPRLILCHVTGFGADGPLGGFPGYDAVVQAMTGLMSVNGHPDGGPMRMGTPIVDIGTGLIACNAILAALVERGRSGLGQAIEVPLFDSAISMLHPQAANSLMSGKVPVSTGNGHPNIVPYDMFSTRTKSIYLAVGNNGQFAKLCEYLGFPELASDPRFIDNANRLKNRDALTSAIGSRLAEMDAEKLEPELLAAGVPAGVVRNVNEALDHAHTKHRGMVVSVGSYRGTGIPARMSRTPGTVRTAPPKFGANTVAVLDEAGYSAQEIQRMISDAVVKTTNE
ncbi:CaiB/BaiF CoA-transferase family protein [Rhizobium rhizogenes]|jgi:crotonobetainyl-CoA:carnitine CoA-transferase CaiB-like acyl-CoA transferase|uniref:CaiB/BaiF CoA transferase family protein n=1 Tax=Rhizobium rhizogenes TaxID=359 RepID=UPI0006470469|nr:CoA transferase [Rhizobium rhizogenes]